MDVCFQCMKVFDVDFSQLSNHIWEFLQSEVYGLEVVNKVKILCDLIDSVREVN